MSSLNNIYGQLATSSNELLNEESSSEVPRLFNELLGLSIKTATTRPFLYSWLKQQRGRLRKMRRTIAADAKLHIRQRPGWRCAMLTLTYAPERQWESGHLPKILSAIRKYLKRKGAELRYLWVLEQTKQGCPHYHVLVWLPPSLEFPMPDLRGWWPWGMTHSTWATYSVSYITKYASKCNPRYPLPKGARLYGSGGLSGAAKIESNWSKLPPWARGLVSRSEEYYKPKGGGITLKVTGEILLAPFKAVFKHGKVEMVKHPSISMLGTI
ncbi:rolling circle replication-associated protein [Undibacterium sp. RuTC16W]|uniref:rolling circle replication-associated protein n=1 Tax=Undibacterium sp. RuTC16W TaxID=3413048 RepID=UPI003BF3ECA1